MLKAMVNSHGFGSTGSRQREVPAGAVSFPVEKQEIPPASLANGRVLVKGGRAISDKDSVDIVRSRMVVELRKIDSRQLKCFNAFIQPITQVETNFWLGQFAERLKACAEPR